MPRKDDRLLFAELAPPSPQRTAGRGPEGRGNRLAPEDRAAHNWYRFVLSFSPHLVRDYLTRFGVDSASVVLDPFCGTGTTVIECKKLGVPSIGIEANPMARFASEVKTRWDVDPDGLLRDAQAVAAAAREELARSGLRDEPGGLWGKAGGALRTLPPEMMKLLLSNSISPLPLHKVLVLLDCLRHVAAERYRDHELLAMAKATVACASNLHFGPEVGVGPPRDDAAVIGPWMAELAAVAEDLRSLRARRDVKSDVIQSDARALGAVVAPASVDFVITSPPYPNEKDYTRTTRLESVLLGFIRSRAELRALKMSLMRSNTRTVYKADVDDLHVAGNRRIQTLAREIESRRIAPGKTSGFERLCARVTKLYFGGMARHLADLRAVLRPGALLAYVVGDQASFFRVMIRTGQILEEIAKTLGYEPIGIDLFRTRRATATGENLREEVVVLRLPRQGGTWRSGGQSGLNAPRKGIP